MHNAELKVNLMKVMVIKMTRSEARKAVLDLLFEREFRHDETDEEIFALSCETREIDVDEYIKTVYFGVCKNSDELDAEINKNAKGWKSARLSRTKVSEHRYSLTRIRRWQKEQPCVELTE